MEIETPSLAETAITGWKYTLTDTFRRVRYSARYQGGYVFLTRNGVAVSAVPDGMAKRFNRMSKNLDEVNQCKS